jgi:hypothetical protein
MKFQRTLIAVALLLTTSASVFAAVSAEKKRERLRVLSTDEFKRMNLSPLDRVPHVRGLHVIRRFREKPFLPALRNRVIEYSRVFLQSEGLCLRPVRARGREFCAKHARGQGALSAARTGAFGEREKRHVAHTRRW